MKTTSHNILMHSGGFYVISGNAPLAAGHALKAVPFFGKIKPKLMNNRGGNQSMKAVAAVLLSLLLLCGCRQPSGSPPEGADLAGVVAVGQELTCLVQNREEALDLAELYDIQLVTFEAGVAVFTTDRSWQEVIEQGKEAGWPELSPNYEMELT
jgi:hypothetical protein